MLLTVEELVRLLRDSVNVQSAETGVVDPAFLVMTDEDLELYIKLGVSRAFPDITDFADLPSGASYPIILTSKIELYSKLAVMNADKVDIRADMNNYLMQNQRFEHYRALIESTRILYEGWVELEGQSEVNSYDVLLSSRHYTQRNYEKQVTPKVALKIDTIASDSVFFHWGVSNTSHFGRFKVYISESPIINLYKGVGNYSSCLMNDPKLVMSTSNIRNTSHSVSNLKPNTTYYVAVISIERNQVFGFSETSFTTLGDLEDEEDFSEDSL